MSEATQVTPGPWEFRQKNGDWHIYADGQSIMCSMTYYPWVPEGEADWKLIAEAGTVHHETGLTPRQLVEQRDALAKALEAMTGFCDEHADFRNGVTDPTGAIDEGNARAAEYFSIARAALSLVKGEPK